MTRTLVAEPPVRTRRRTGLLAGIAVALALVLWAVMAISRARPPELSLWQETDPVATAAAGDEGPVELGVRFSSAAPGQVLGVRYYAAEPPPAGAAEVVGSLWDAEGALLARATFGAGDPPGWREVRFDRPVAVEPAAGYVASYQAADGRYAVTQDFFPADAADPGPLRAEQGVFRYGDGAFPSDTYRGSNYWVDVVFVATGPASPAPEAPAPEAAAAGAGEVRPRPPTPVSSYTPAYWARWENGPSADPSFFPIGVWMQDPDRTAAGYRALGVNTFVGLWEGPQEHWLEALAANDLTALSGAATDVDAEVLTGHVLADEPDMNVSPEAGGCLTPEQVAELAREARAADPTRPVYLNGGKGFALPDFYGGANCHNQRPADYDAEHPESWYQQDFLPGADDGIYAEYLREVDICSVDYYAVTDPYEPERHRGIWAYGRAVRRMRAFCGPDKPVWAFVETTQIWDDAGQVTPEQVRSIVWTSLIAGANGIEYFAHSFAGGLTDDALLKDPAMVEEVTAINTQITELAPVLNSPTLADAVTVDTVEPAVGVDTMAKRHGGDTYVFAIGGGSGATAATFTLAGGGSGEVEVLGEDRTLDLTDGRFTDDFADYSVHLYRMRA